MKKFNTTAICIPEKHYMVDISDKLEQIKAMIVDGAYFTINRGRQYGKTTTLYLLEKYIQKEYLCISISFEGVGQTFFASEQDFCHGFIEIISDNLQFTLSDENTKSYWKNQTAQTFPELSRAIRDFCENRSVVLMIDEVDKASDFRLFLDFLGLLRDKFINRSRGKDHTFQSVILAGVHDIRNIKLKMIQSGTYEPQNGEGQYNSPWNIAVDFEVDMSFHPGEIATMLQEYQNERKIRIDIHAISHEIYQYTSGYPYLVSRICKLIDEKLKKDWSIAGVQSAVKLILSEKNTLFDDLFKNLENDKMLYELLYAILIIGEERKYSIDVPTINFASTFGIIKNEDVKVKIANRIFEIRICEYFISIDEGADHKPNVLKYDIVKNGRFDMKRCLTKFAEYYEEIYTEKEATFLEKHCRLLFLTYLRPLINGEGFYHIESGFTDLRRMDLVIDYNKEQFVVELKIWDGERKHQDAYQQLAGYLEKKNQKTGYLLTFNFNQNRVQTKKIASETFGAYEIFDVIL
ncbi:MAG: ATP-binding protein [Lachnospiraceae bacterium]|jgi:hypothetical protein|nr:ATP-binding protein [Lachnospiraceae bacterium]